MFSKLLLTLASLSVVYAQPAAVDWVSQVGRKPFLDARLYNFFRIFTQSIAPGTNTLIFKPVPLGVNGTDSAHYLYIGRIGGAAESCLITGGTGISGAASGTITFTCANTHTNGYTVESANGGITEAIWDLPPTGGEINVPVSVTIHAPIKRRLNMPIWITGIGMQATILSVASDFSLSASGVFDWSPGDVAAVPIGGVNNLTILFTQPDSTNLAFYTHWPPAIYSTGTFHSDWHDLTILLAWDVAISRGNNTNGIQFSNIFASWFHHGIEIDRDLDAPRIKSFHGSTAGLTSNQITAFLGATNPALYIGHAHAIEIVDLVSASGQCADFHTGADALIAGGFIYGLWCDGGFVMSNGDLRIDGAHLHGSGTISAFTITGGSAKITNSNFEQDSGNASAIIANASTTTPIAPTLEISNSIVQQNGANPADLVLITTGGSYIGIFQVTLTGNQFVRPLGSTGPSIAVLAGTGDPRLTASGNTMSDNPSLLPGHGQFFTFDTDSYHSVDDSNVGNGWDNTLPSLQQKGKYPSYPRTPSLAVVASAILVPTGPVFALSGTTTVTGISPVAGFPYSEFTVIPSDATPFTAGASIGASTTTVAGKAMHFVLASGVWYPSY